MSASIPLSALELREAARNGERIDKSRLNRVLGIDAQRGLIEVQGGTPWRTIAAELRPQDPRALAASSMATVGSSIARNAAGPDGAPTVNHVASLALVTPDGDLKRVSRNRDAELFALAVGGQGLFGTIYSVTLFIRSLAAAVERQAEPERLTLRPHARAQPPLALLLPPEAVDGFVRQTDVRCNDWRIGLHSVAIRRTLGEEETYLRWARRDYAEVNLSLARPGGLGGMVRSGQLRRELIDAAIALGGSFQIASTPEATRAQVEACYPQLKGFLAQKRRFDPNERVINDWYRHQRSVLTCEPCEVRWAS
ncbi:MAG TPA: FAD-binding protein [Burkholderiales bacterium]|nr:FAD-binding protein [Burkholderiales bacterium]